MTLKACKVVDVAVRRTMNYILFFDDSTQLTAVNNLISYADNFVFIQQKESQGQTWLLSVSSYNYINYLKQSYILYN